jgi:hypothetical protein
MRFPRIVLLSSSLFIGSIAMLASGGWSVTPISETELVSARGTNNQYPQLQTNNVNVFGTCATLNAPVGNTAATVCLGTANGTACIRCNSQTTTISPDVDKTVPTGGYAFAANNIVCGGFIIAGGTCQNGSCIGGATTTVACTIDLPDVIQQQVPGGP